MLTNLKTPDEKKRERMQCACKTCNFQVTPYTAPPHIKTASGQHGMRKAGALLYDQATRRICLVQSRGNLWGCPKGSLLESEEFVEGAKREVEEETGIQLQDADLHTPLWISPTVVYYYVERSYRDGGELQYLTGNDANGLVWIKMTCLRDLLREDKIRITSHTRKAIHIALSEDLPRKMG